ncbi:MAG TPA: hypothetical protein VG965_06965 [Patescibacteria group bacterium]|nr:hypothetical protein [Patescibacteria group bacterium]
MTGKFFKTALLWGFILWLFGYIMGIAFYAFLPASMIGWVIMPFGIIATIWVLYKKIELANYKQYVMLAFVWLVIAVFCDYFLLVKLFNPVDGYYKLDVYVYYFLTFILPLYVGYLKTTKK